MIKGKAYLHKLEVLAQAPTAAKLPAVTAFILAFCGLAVTLKAIKLVKRWLLLLILSGACL